ncbi:YdaS family helix-turn-helix protein [Entomobacter blattae]|uniref:Antitoxin of bacterial toxin-antitoxin system, YdaS/YdaT n=1 Tax=Entomobacter blattae TaxID=2762277 RepID=A0A7H1NP82_9PROT|nr:YdaS family helix-turn-helix protein [Entomobacter blattae]QNT77592.1 Putative antitoxin of bacterial toxin-antitoxin system, YdaS/YdaT [Entomobacter blattae]
MISVSELIEKAGGVVTVARAVNRTHPAIIKWKKGKVPSIHVLTLAKMAGVNPEEVRPDVFGNTDTEEEFKK